MKIAQARELVAAIVDLRRDPSQTQRVFDLVYGFGTESVERSFRRFRTHPQGRALLQARPSLLEALTDTGSLMRLPPGTLGRDYAEFMKRQGISADGLIAAAAAARGRPVHVDADLQWFDERTRDMHDLVHVLTGLETSVTGELRALAFTQAQLPNRGVALILLVAIVLGPKRKWLRWQRNLYRAWRMGREATWLALAPFEALLDQPLAEVRRQLGVRVA